MAERLTKEYLIESMEALLRGERALADFNHSKNIQSAMTSTFNLFKWNCPNQLSALLTSILDKYGVGIDKCEIPYLVHNYINRIGINADCKLFKPLSAFYELPLDEKRRFIYGKSAITLERKEFPPRGEGLEVIVCIDKQNLADTKGDTKYMTREEVEDLIKKRIRGLGVVETPAAVPSKKGDYSDNSLRRTEAAEEIRKRIPKKRYYTFENCMAKGDSAQVGEFLNTLVELKESDLSSEEIEKFTGLF